METGSKTSRSNRARSPEWLPSLAFLWALIFHEHSLATALDTATLERIHQFTLKSVQSQPIAQAASPQSPAPRVHIEVGAPDSRLQLAACSKTEVFVPAGVRLAGPTRIGLKCIEGATAWSISVPVTIRIYGRGLVAINSVVAGAPITAQDVAMGEVDLASDASPALTDLQAVEGRTLARSMSTGQGLRLAHLKPRQWFSAGDTVKLVASGNGFLIAGQGQALSPGIDGQPVRVRTEGGRVVSGTAVADRQVSLDM